MKEGKEKSSEMKSLGDERKSRMNGERKLGEKVSEGRQGWRRDRGEEGRGGAEGNGSASGSPKVVRLFKSRNSFCFFYSSTVSLFPVAFPGAWVPQRYTEEPHVCFGIWQ